MLCYFDSLVSLVMSTTFDINQQTVFLFLGGNTRYCGKRHLNIVSFVVFMVNTAVVIHSFALEHCLPQRGFAPLGGYDTALVDETSWGWLLAHQKC